MPTPPRYSVAVVEDDAGLRTDLVEFLELRGFAVHGFESAEDFLKTWPATSFDLLLLDVALPGASGLEIAQRVRARDAVGIVMLTAFDSDQDHVTGLDAGADVFLSKRSSLEVIEATCLSVLRRLNRGVLEDTNAGDLWRLDVPDWRLSAPNGTSTKLTYAEVTLISSLFEAPNHVVSREALLARLDRQETISGLRNLDNIASRLRRKVKADCGMELPVRPSYSRGYTFTGKCEVSK